MPKDWIVSRHTGAIQWLQARLAHEGQGRDLCVVEHLDTEDVQAGDRVFGILPMHLAAAVGERQAQCWMVQIDTPREWRGRDLTAADMDTLGARLREVRVQLGAWWPHDDTAQP